MQLFHKWKTFSRFYAEFLTYRLNFQHFQKKLTFKANVFPKLRTRKEALREVSKKRRFNVPFHKQHGKGEETPSKLSRRHLYHTYWSPIRIFSLKKSLLVICKSLWLFVNTFTAYEKYSPLNRDYFTQQINMKLSQKSQTFSRFHAAFLTSRLNFRQFKKKLTLIANVFPKLRTRKEALRWVSKKCRFTVLFNKQPHKGAQTHFKSSLWHLYHNCWALITILSLKKSLLAIWKILWVYFNTFTAYEKYYPRYRENCTSQIHMISSKKRKTFPEFFMHFWNLS